VLNWNQERENQFFEKVDNLKKAVKDFVNKNVGKHSKIDKVEVMEKPFEKSATQKIRRFVYTSDTEKNDANEKTAEAEENKDLE
jgi:long-chain acyl-CoA synthetase